MITHQCQGNPCQICYPLKAQLMTPEERAEKILNELSLEGDERFVSSGYAYYEDAKIAISTHVREAVEEAYELANKDFNWLQGVVGKIYCHFTDNKLSKWNYEPEAVISEIEDCQNAFWEKEIDKAKAEAYEEAAKYLETRASIIRGDWNGPDILNQTAHEIRALKDKPI